MNRKSTPTPRLRRTGKIILISILSVLIVAGGILVFSRGVFKAKPVEQKTDLAESIDDFNIDPQDQLNYKNEIIPLLWEDNNDGENLIIKTDRQYHLEASLPSGVSKRKNSRLEASLPSARFRVVRVLTDIIFLI